MGSIYIRAATPEDWEIVVDFNFRLAQETESKTLNLEATRTGVKTLLADSSKGRYFVACLAERIVGQAMHTWEWSDWRNGEIWWLQSVYVHPDYRRQGVFRLLYQHLLQKAEADPNVVGLRLYVENDNARAQQTYQRLGMRQTGYSVMENLFH